jgi:glucuronate isomerase
MSRPLSLHSDRLFPADAGTRALARSLYEHVHKLPIISPHGHTDPAWFAYNEPFGDAVDLLLAPDHYLYRMLYSHGVALDKLGVRTRQGAPKFEPREAWRLFAAHYKLFRGTASALWLDQVFAEVFGLKVRLEAETADF